MKQAKLFRTKDDQTQTIGYITCEDFKADTLELPFINNTPMISCVPAGIYPVKWTYSQRHGKYMYQIIDVPYRTGIRFDVANKASQLKGCVAIGNEYRDIDGNGQLDILNSQTTNDAFNAFFNKEDFQLTIIDNFSPSI